MNNIRLFISLAILSLEVVAFSQKISLDRDHHDFGQIEESDSLYSSYFKLINISKDTLDKIEVTSACNCISSSFKDKVIPPTDSLDFQVFYNSKNHSGRFDKKIKIKSDKDSLFLTLSGTVVPNQYYSKDQFEFSIGPFLSKTKFIQLGQIIEKSSINKEFILYNPDTVNHQIILLNKETYTVSRDSITISPKTVSTFLINFDALPELGIGYKTDQLNFTLDEKDQLSIPIAYTIIPNTSVGNNGILHSDTLNYNFPRTKNGSIVEKTFILKNKGSETLHITEVKSECECVSFKLKNKKIKSGDSSNIKVSFDSTGRTGTQRKKIHIYTDSKKTPVLTLHFKGVISK